VEAPKALGSGFDLVGDVEKLGTLQHGDRAAEIPWALPSQMMFWAKSAQSLLSTI
jgi:hypothetical protein